MRVLFVTPQYLPWLGGLEVLCSQLLAGLKERGHHMAVVTGTGDARWPKGRTDIDGIPVWRCFDYADITGRNASGLLRLRRDLATFVEEFQPDVVHAHDPGAVLWLYQRAARRRRPLLLTAHVVLRQHAPELLGNARRFAESADWVTGVSADVVDDVLSFAPSVRDRISLVPNGLPAPDGVMDPVLDGPARFLCIGRLVRQKGFDIALEAMALIKERHDDVLLEIVGEGPEAGALQEMILSRGLSGQVTMLGRVERDRIGALLGRSTAVLLPSRWEGLPLVALEAAFMGRPVIAADAPGARLTVRDGATGRLVAAEDSVSLAEAVIDLADDRVAAARMGCAARSWAQREWSLSTCIDRYEAIYERLGTAGRD